MMVLPMPYTHKTPTRQPHHLLILQLCAGSLPLFPVLINLSIYLSVSLLSLPCRLRGCLPCMAWVGVVG